MIKPYFFRNADGSYRVPRFAKDRFISVVDDIRLRNPNKEMLSYGVALDILGFTFGSVWLERHILSEPRDGFLGRSLQTVNGSSLVVHRVRDLSELIVNLSHVEGIEAPLDQIACGQIESGYAELEAGKIAASLELPFRFVVPVGVKGRDYDIEIVFPEGETICVDTKCKIEDRDFSSVSILETLRKARKQLPMDEKNCVFVKIPENWTKLFNIVEDLTAICRDFFESTSRVLLVRFFSSIVEIGNERIVHMYSVMDMWHPEYFETASSHLLVRPFSVYRDPPGWISVAALAGDALEQ